ncbi:hypothetical protein [Bremerella cremea]|uniref:hypothetical protein n=1 Tax=Bremerella cremea TaxID=1031537 RepID=UPI0031ED4AE8
MAEEQQWLALGQITTESPQPPDRFIEAAAKSVPAILADVKLNSDGTVSLESIGLIRQLRKLGHTSAASDWAILRLLKSEYLTAIPKFSTWFDPGGFPILRRPTAQQLRARTLAHQAAQQMVVTFSPHAEFSVDSLEVFATEALWQWWRDFEDAQEVGERAYDEAAGSKTHHSPKRRGRKKADYATQEKENRIFDAWKRARDSGASKAQFASDQGMPEAELNRLIERVSKRKSRSEESFGQ